MSSTAAVTIEGRSAIVFDDLLQRVGFGDRRAFEQLYALTSPRLFGLVRRVLRDPSQSEEVSQEVYLEVWQTASRYDRSKGRCLTWMFTMAHRRAVDRVRASQSSRDRDLRIGMRDQDSPRDTVAEQVEVSVEGARMRRAIATLSLVQRQAIELSYFSGYTQGEVAEMRGTPVGTVKTRVRDGLIKLRTLLADSEPLPAVATAG